MRSGRNHHLLGGDNTEKSEDRSKRTSNSTFVETCIFIVIVTCHFMHKEVSPAVEAPKGGHGNPQEVGREINKQTKQTAAYKGFSGLAAATGSRDRRGERESLIGCTFDTFSQIPVSTQKNFSPPRADAANADGPLSKMFETLCVPSENVLQPAAVQSPGGGLKKKGEKGEMQPGL